MIDEFKDTRFYKKNKKEDATLDLNTEQIDALRKAKTLHKKAEKLNEKAYVLRGIIEKLEKKAYSLFENSSKLKKTVYSTPIYPKKYFNKYPQYKNTIKFIFDLNHTLRSDDTIKKTETIEEIIRKDYVSQYHALMFSLLNNYGNVIYFLPKSRIYSIFQSFSEILRYVNKASETSIKKFARIFLEIEDIISDCPITNLYVLFCQVLYSGMTYIDNGRYNINDIKNDNDKRRCAYIVMENRLCDLPVYIESKQDKNYCFQKVENIFKNTDFEQFKDNQDKYIPKLFFFETLNNNLNGKDYFPSDIYSTKTKQILTDLDFKNLDLYNTYSKACNEGSPIIMYHLLELISVSKSRCHDFLEECVLEFKPIKLSKEKV